MSEPPLHSLFRDLYTASEARGFGISFDDFAAALDQIGKDHLAPDSCESQRITFFKSLHIGDLALARGCSRGSPQAWERFLTLYQNRILTSAQTISRNEFDARELAESFLGDLFGTTKLASYIGRGTLGAWLRAVLTHAHLDRCRSRRRRFVSLETHPGFLKALSVTQDADLTRPDCRLEIALKDVLAERDPRDRYLLAGYFFDGRTLAELAQTLGVHESTVSRRLDRLISDIRRSVKSNLRRRGMTERQIKESLQSDIRAFSLSWFDRLLQGANPGQE